MFGLNLDNKTIFFYVIIFIIIVYVFSFLSIGLNLVFGVLVAIFILYFLYTNYGEMDYEERQAIKAQHDLLLPDPGVARKYDDIVRYLFSIQDMYVNNADAYTELTNGLDNFFRIYENTLVNPQYAGRNYELMRDQKRKSMNALHSLVHTVPVTVHHVAKIEDAMKIMKEILQKYLDNAERIHKLFIYETGYNCDVKLIDKSGILPHNLQDGRDIEYGTLSDPHGGHNNPFTYEMD
jgi:hypothetical protein